MYWSVRKQNKEQSKYGHLGESYDESSKVTKRTGVKSSLAVVCARAAAKRISMLRWEVNDHGGMKRCEWNEGDSIF
jgi:hypothetical protein